MAVNGIGRISCSWLSVSQDVDFKFFWTLVAGCETFGSCSTRGLGPQGLEYGTFRPLVARVPDFSVFRRQGTILLGVEALGGGTFRHLGARVRDFGALISC